jgi:methylenetetrahydrofolate dehydrogenase (NADP+) / methenyltetrahydrofolate cyclohydrolase
MARVIRGKEMSEVIRAEIKIEVEACVAKTGKVPGLAVVQVGEDPASSVYVTNKKKATVESGMKSFGYHLPADVTREELLDLIDTLNADENVHGILCQLPLPKHLDEFEVLCRVSPDKDVDGFHPVNVGLLSIGRRTLVSCTPAGVLEMLRRSDIPISGKECVIIGRSNIVGKPVAQLMLSQNATVTIAHSRTADLKEVSRRADILIVAIGKPKFVNAEFVKPGAVVVDVGINRDENGKIVGDVDFASVSEVAGAITPVPFGVGPMTITMLLSNTLTAFKTIHHC